MLYESIVDMFRREIPGEAYLLRLDDAKMHAYEAFQE